MRNKILSSILALVVGAGLVLAPAAPAYSQAASLSAYDKVADGVPAGGGTGLLSTYVPILIRYIGSGTGGTVTVDAASGDLTLSTGPVGGSAVDTTLECPVSAPLGGVIDVSNAACDTLGEVVDIINGSANWRAVILDGVRSDSSNNTLITLAETAANGVDGLGLLADSVVSLNITRALVPDEARKIGFYLDRRNPGTGSSNRFSPNPFINTRAAFFRLQANFTGTGASSVKILSSRDTLSQGTVAGSAVIKTEYQETGAATTVDFTLDFSEVGFFGPKDARLLVRYDAATTFTAGKLFASAQLFQYK